MTLPWTAAQIEWLQAMGLDVLRDARAQPQDAAETPRPLAPAHDAPQSVPAGLLRAARGVDLAPLLAVHGIPRDVAARRALWRALRPLRRAARRS